MKLLMRGGAILSLCGLLVVFIYAQTQTEFAADITNDSQQNLIKTELNLINNNIQPEETPEIQIKKDNKPATETDNRPALKTEPIIDQKNKTETTGKDDKKLVTKTGSSRVARAGASRGTFVATAYCLRGKTAMGHGVRRGIIAADPRVVKLGSNIVVEGGGYSGTYLVSDTGGKIKGNRLDIWMPSCAEARKFGRRKVQVFSAR